MNKRKNLGVPAETHMKIERVAVEITAKTGKVTKWTDVVNFMINNYLTEAKHDMISQVESKQIRLYTKNSDFSTEYRTKVRM